MAGSIRLRAGSRASMPRLSDREPAYVRDEQALYIGTPSGNLRLTFPPLPAMPSLPPLAAEADTASIIAAYNALLTALEDSGRMTKGVT